MDGDTEAFAASASKKMLGGDLDLARPAFEEGDGVSVGKVVSAELPNTGAGRRCGVNAPTSISRLSEESHLGTNGDKTDVDVRDSSASSSSLLVLACCALACPASLGGVEIVDA